MSQEMNYELSFIDTINQLSGINSQLMFEHKDGKIKVRANTPSKTILYYLNAPESYFNFKGTNLCMIDYKEFVKYFKTFNKPSKDASENEVPELFVEPDVNGEPLNMVIKSSKNDAQLTYRLCDADVIQKPTIPETPSLPPFSNATLHLTEKQMKQISEMITLISPENIKFKVDGDKCTIRLFNKMSNNKFEQVYKLSESVESKFTLDVAIAGYNLLPCVEYNISFSDLGLLKYTPVRSDDIDLVVYLAVSDD